MKSIKLIYNDTNPVSTYIGHIELKQVKAMVDEFLGLKSSINELSIETVSSDTLGFLESYQASLQSFNLEVYYNGNLISTNDMFGVLNQSFDLISDFIDNPLRDE